MSRRICPPPILGAPIIEPPVDARASVIAAVAAEGDRLEREWEAWHRTFGVMQRDAGRMIWGIAQGMRSDGDVLGPTPEQAVLEARRRALNTWRAWAGTFPEAMTADSYDVTEAIIRAEPWEPFLLNRNCPPP